MKSGIYRITCTANGKVYIGSAQNLRKRWTQHRGLLDNNAHYNGHLQNSWNKHGSEAFTWDVVEYVEDERLIEREQHYLDLYRSAKREHGFNLYPTAGSPLGRVLSDESKEKLRIANLGKKAAPETRAKMSETRRGKKLSPEWAENIRQGQLGKVISAETRAKLSLSMKGRHLSLET